MHKFLTNFNYIRFSFIFEIKPRETIFLKAMFDFKKI